MTTASPNGAKKQESDDRDTGPSRLPAGRKQRDHRGASGHARLQSAAQVSRQQQEDAHCTGHHGNGDKPCGDSIPKIAPASGARHDFAINQAANARCMLRLARASRLSARVHPH